ncbi:MAG: phosphoglycerate dehydrogenase [Deltaproteobacteria bacterium]|nr:phosphoglycerate dehydrogenase [Deltaproteobacteria bacterium]
MAKWKVFWLEPRPQRPDIVERLEAAGCEVVLGRPFTEADKAFSEDELVELVRGMDALMVGTRERFTRRVMQAAPRLRTVAKHGIGVERIEVAAATDLGILVSNTPIPENYLSVAEGTMARILALAKQLKLADRNARAGAWKSITNVFVKGKTIGIIGLGRVGQRVAELLQPWEVRLMAFDPYVPKERAEALHVQLVDLPTLRRESDFVTVHAVATAETRKLLGEAQFRQMKPTAYLVNTARGLLIDEAALVRALKEGWIAGCALDVFDPEPPAPDSPLLAEAHFFKTLYSPHAAGGTPEVAQAMPTAQLANTLAALRGQVPRFVVNPEVIPRWQERLKRLGE